MTTGDIANGRSMSALITLWPRNFWRTSTNAAATPKTVLIGTAMTAMSTVRYRACSVSGSVTASITGPQPVLERPVDDQHDRQQQQRGQVGEDDRPQREPTPHGAAPSFAGA